MISLFSHFNFNNILKRPEDFLFVNIFNISKALIGIQEVFQEQKSKKPFSKS